jgi:hypothetical protein
MLKIISLFLLFIESSIINLTNFIEQRMMCSISPEL